MRYPYVLLLLALLTSCGPSPEQQIAELEAQLEPEYRITTVDSLIQLYQQVASAHPDDHALNADYLNKSAELAFDNRKDGAKAFSLLSNVVDNHSEGQDLSIPIEMMARIWNARRFNAATTSKLTEEDTQRLKTYLLDNQTWIDSSLTRLDNEMGSPVVKDKGKAKDFIEVAHGYASLIEEDKLDKAVRLYLLAGGLAKSIDLPNKALELYFEVAEKHQDHPKAPTALFMMGHIYEDDLSDVERAQSAYQTFLERYPDDPDYADDATNALKYLGKSPEELILEFEKMNKGQIQ